MKYYHKNSNCNNNNPSPKKEKKKKEEEEKLPCIIPSACQGFERFDETERLKPLNLNDYWCITLVEIWKPIHVFIGLKL